MRSKSKAVRGLSAAILLLVGLSVQSRAQETRSFQFDSGHRQVALIELYTSEGCSSCPPADGWLSQLKSSGGLWHDFVPVALHVDYWNYIGWQDRFSRPEYTQRQQDYVSAGSVRVAYTPGFFNNGQEWRGWFSGKDLTFERPSVGNLSLAIQGTTVAVRFDPEHRPDSELVVNVAVLGMDLETEVQAGENSGKRLVHDFVVLSLQSTAMINTGNGFKALDEMEPLDVESSALALVAWVTSKDDQTPLQSVGGYLR